MAPEPATSIIDRAVKMRKEMEAQKGLLAWALLNVSLAGMIYTEMSGNLISSYYNTFLLELALASLFSLNAAFGFWVCFKYMVAPTSLVVSPCQQSLLGLQNAAVQTTPPRELAAPSPPPQGQSVLSYSPSCRPAPAHSLVPIVSRGTAPRTGSVKQNQGGILSSFYGTTICFPLPKVSSSSPRRSPSPLALGHWKAAGLRSHCGSSPALCNSAGAEEYVTDLRALHAFLWREEQKQQIVQLGIVSGCLDFSFPSSSPALGNCSRSIADCAQVLRKFQYHLACRPWAPSPHNDGPDLCLIRAAEEVWAQGTMQRHLLGHVDSWTTKVRNWVNETILVPLVQQIESVSTQMQRMVCPELQIGEATISSLKQAAPLRLDQTPNRQYLVEQRISLGQWGSMGSSASGVGRCVDHSSASAGLSLRPGSPTPLQCRSGPCREQPDSQAVTGNSFLQDKARIKTHTNMVNSHAPKFIRKAIPYIFLYILKITANPCVALVRAHFKKQFLSELSTNTTNHAQLVDKFLLCYFKESLLTCFFPNKHKYFCF
uniref:Transmembrane protein 209 n=1 Tax=Athene cunicularia TaxID=194338 RepID=A0A663N2J6_ATHCN